MAGPLLMSSWQDPHPRPRSCPCCRTTPVRPCRTAGERLALELRLVPGEFEVLVLECPGLREFRKDTFGRALRHGEAVGKVDIRRRAAADRRQQLGDVRLRAGTIVIFTQISGFAWLKLSTILAIVSEAGRVLRPELDLGRPGLTTGTCDGRFFGAAGARRSARAGLWTRARCAGLAAPCEHAPSTRANAITTTNGDRLRDHS